MSALAVAKSDIVLLNAQLLEVSLSTNMAGTL